MLDFADDYDEPDWSADPVRLSFLPPGEQVAILKRCAPRARDLFVLALIDPLELDDAGRIDLLTVFDEIERTTAAAKLRVLAAIELCDNTELHLAEEQVALALTVPGRSAQRQLQLASTLADSLPATARLLDEGQISGKHAEILAEASWRLPPELAGELEAAVLPKAPLQTAPTFARSVRRAELRLDPADAETRHQRARQDRRVGCQPIEDGMVSMPVVLAAADGQAIFTRLTAAALRLPSTDPRTMDQKRADLLVDAVLTGIPADGLPKVQGRAPSIQVVVAADTLLELDDEPAHLTGYGPLTAETARRLAADESGTWRRLLTDPAGRLVDISEHRYRPSRRLRDFVSVRDDVCSFPTCNQPGYRCEYEHIVAYRPGDSTCAGNGALACRRHNRCKIKTGWSYTMDDDGSFVWTTATGHEYRNVPVERWPLPNRLSPPESEFRTAEVEDPGPPRRRANLRAIGDALAPPGQTDAGGDDDVAHGERTQGAEAGPDDAEGPSGAAVLGEATVQHEARGQREAEGQRKARGQREAEGQRKARGQREAVEEDRQWQAAERAPRDRTNQEQNRAEAGRGQVAENNNFLPNPDAALDVPPY